MEWTGIEGNLPRWYGANVVYSRAYAYMRRNGADDDLIEALASGDEEIIKGVMLELRTLAFWTEMED